MKELPEYESFTGPIAKEFINSCTPKPSAVKIAKKVKCTPFQLSAFLNQKVRRPKMTEAQVRAFYDILKGISEAEKVPLRFKKQARRPRVNGN